MNALLFCNLHFLLDFWSYGEVCFILYDVNMCYHFGVMLMLFNNDRLLFYMLLENFLHYLTPLFSYSLPFIYTPFIILPSFLSLILFFVCSCDVLMCVLGR